MASFKSVFRPQARTISPLLILMAALLLGMFVYGFTAPAALNNDANLAGGQGNAVGIAFNLDSNTVDYGFTGAGGSLSVTSVNFNVVAPTGANFSSGVRIFAKLNTDPTATYTLCTRTPAAAVANTLAAACTGLAAINLNSAAFGLDVVVIE